MTRPPAPRTPADGPARPTRRGAADRAAADGAGADGARTTRNGTARGSGAREGAASDRADRSRPDRERRDRARRRPTAVDYRRRRLAALLAALVLLVGLGFTVRVLLYDAGLADVEGVRVTGVTTIPVAEVEAAAAVVAGGPLADVDTRGIAERVARLPAVATVRVGLGWPHTVDVEVTERVPVATAGAPGGVALVDSTGVVYPGTPPPGLPRLTFGAVGPDDPSTRDALACLAALPDPLRAQVLTVDVTVAGVGIPGQVAFGLTDDRQVRWGTPDRAADKAAVLGPLLTEPGRVYDVTSPDLPTVRR